MYIDDLDLSWMIENPAATKSAWKESAKMMDNFLNDRKRAVQVWLMNSNEILCDAIFIVCRRVQSEGVVRSNIDQSFSHKKVEKPPTLPKTSLLLIIPSTLSSSACWKLSRQEGGMGLCYRLIKKFPRCRSEIRYLLHNETTFPSTYNPFSLIFIRQSEKWRKKFPLERWAWKRAVWYPLNNAVIPENSMRLRHSYFLVNFSYRSTDIYDQERNVCNTAPKNF